MKKLYWVLGLSLMLALPLYAASKAQAVKHSAETMKLEGWIDFEPDSDNGVKKPQFSTDFELDTSAVSAAELNRYASEKVVVEGKFITRENNKPVFILNSLHSADKGRDTLENEGDSLDVELNEDLSH